VGVVVLCTLGPGCRSTPSESRYARHFDAAPWNGAASAQLDHVDRFVPEVVLLTAVPLCLPFDHSLNQSASGGVSDSTAQATDALTIGMGVAAGGVGLLDWSGGDDGAHFEIALESVTATALATGVLKQVVRRPRPDSSSTTSFPSGHTSFATAAATLLVQDVQDANGGTTPAWAWGLYAPALYIGVERVASDRHWASDVAAGAFLGVLIPNLIHDAHLSRSGEGQGILDPPHRMAWSLGPGIDDQGRLGLALDLSF
jgi:PAP2 superfamily